MISKEILDEMTVENGLPSTGSGLTILDGVDVMTDLNLFYIRQIGASLRKHVGIQDKLEREIKLRDGASRMLAACTHEDQLLEVAKTLHTSNARMYTYMAELQKLKTAEIMERAMDEDGSHSESKVCSGRIAISDIRIPLMWNDPERYSGTKIKEASRYAVFCLVRVGSEVQDTELVCTDKSTTDVGFRDVLVFEDATFNFKMDIEIHAFPMSEESISAPTPQKLLSRLNRSIGKSEGKRMRDRLKESPAANMKMGPQYEKLGSLTLDLNCVDDNIKSHDITQLASLNSASARAKPLLPLYGSLTCRLVAQPRCITEKCVTGFIHCMAMSGGVPCWSYMWCEARAGKLRCWSNPEDAAEKEPHNSINLIAQDIRINEIEKSRQKRPNSFQVRDLVERHIFSTNSKEDMNRWIRGLRQHKSDYAAWNNACSLQKDAMIIASPSPSKLPSHLLFDSSIRKTLVYEQMSMDSPTKSDGEITEIGNILNRGETTPDSVGVAMIEANQSAPWAGLFSGALNRPMMKVTKLKDVQNIGTPKSSSAKKTLRPRTKSCDNVLSPSSRSSKHAEKKEHHKPPLPRRPSEDLVNDRKKLYVTTPTSSRTVPKIENLKSCDTSESCSETALSDMCHSSDDVFLSSDENLLNSLPNCSKTAAISSGCKGKATSKGRKKRRAPMPPSSGQQVNADYSGCHPKGEMHRRYKSKTSLSSGSSLDDVLEDRNDSRKMSHQLQDSYLMPSPSPRARRANDIYIQDSDHEGRKSQLSLASNSTQVSNTSSGYKSDSEGLNNIPTSPASWHKKIASDQQENEILDTECDVKSKSYGRKGVKVLPTGVPLKEKLTTQRGAVYTRSHSCDADSFLRTMEDACDKTKPFSSDHSTRPRTESAPPANAMKKKYGKPPCFPKPITNSSSSASVNKSDKLFMKMLCSQPGESPSVVRPPFPRPIPAPRRSYLTAVESSKIKPENSPLYETPSSCLGHLHESGGVHTLSTPRGMSNTVVVNDDIYAQAIPKSLRSSKNSNNNNSNQEEPIYAQVNKVKKSSASSTPISDPRHELEPLRRRVGVDAYVKAHRAIITVCKQRMEEEEKARKEKKSAENSVARNKANDRATTVYI